MRENNRTLSISVAIMAMILVFYIIYIWSSLIIPLVIAVIISFLIISLSKFFQKKWLNKYISFPLSIITFLLFFFLLGQLINSNIQEIWENSENYQKKFVNIMESVEESLNINKINFINNKGDSSIEGESGDEKINIWKFVNYDDILTKINIPFLVSYIAGGITSVFKNMWIIFFYTVFILLEARFFYKKIDLMFSNEWREKVLEVLELIQKDVKSYFVIKTIISLITAISSFFFMMIFDVDFALFWAFLIFLLNYIPNIGSIVAVFFPVLFSIIQFQSLPITLGITACLAWIQILMWNIIEPRFMWNKLNLSPLVILISLIFWWTLWGVIGMLLAVPIMVIMNIILSHIKSTRSIAILLSEKWIIKTDFWNVEEKKKVIDRIKEKFTKK